MILFFHNCDFFEIFLNIFDLYLALQEKSVKNLNV